MTKQKDITKGNSKKRKDMIIKQNESYVPQRIIGTWNHLNIYVYVYILERKTPTKVNMNSKETRVTIVTKVI